MEQPASGLPGGLLSYCGGFYPVPGRGGGGAGFAELCVPSVSSLHSQVPLVLLHLNPRTFSPGWSLL